MAKASAGNPDAQFRVGVQYELGAHVPRIRPRPQHGTARLPTRLSAGAAQPGVLYELGSGVPADPVTAAQWYRKAAEQGFAPAQFSLDSATFTAKEFRKTLGKRSRGIQSGEAK